MINIKSTWRIGVAGSAALAFLAACNDGSSPSPAAPPPSQGADFSVFVDQVFSNSANSTPVPLNGLQFIFDVNDDPTAFDALINSGSF
jgi:hypothetical protein